VSQYWDKNHLFAEQLAGRLNSDAGHPQPSCCNRRGIQWDEVAVYPQDVNWDGQLPRAVYLDGPIVRALDFANVVAELLSKAADSKPMSEKSQPMRQFRPLFLCRLEHQLFAMRQRWESSSKDIAATSAPLRLRRIVFFVGMSTCPSYPKF
jgi:hypothetical protein